MKSRIFQEILLKLVFMIHFIEEQNQVYSFIEMAERKIFSKLQLVLVFNFCYSDEFKELKGLSKFDDVFILMK